MKHNEVMIGDWVRFTDPDTDETELIRVATDDIGYDSEEFWQCFSPIEITPEILEANGIRHYKDCGRLSFYKRMDADFVIRYEIYAGYIGIELCDGNRISVERITKVHELQHVMKLIGLNDLAVNFKLEKGGDQ